MTKKERGAKAIIQEVADREAIAVDRLLGRQRTKELLPLRIEIAKRLKNLDLHPAEIGALMNRDRTSKFRSFKGYILACHVSKRS